MMILLTALILDVAAAVVFWLGVQYAVRKHLPNLLRTQAQMWGDRHAELERGFTTRLTSAQQQIAYLQQQAYNQAYSAGTVNPAPAQQPVGIGCLTGPALGGSLPPTP